MLYNLKDNEAEIQFINSKNPLLITKISFDKVDGR